MSTHIRLEAMNTMRIHGRMITSRDAVRTMAVKEARRARWKPLVDALETRWGWLLEVLGL